MYWISGGIIGGETTSATSVMGEVGHRGVETQRRPGPRIWVEPRAAGEVSSWCQSESDRSYEWCSVERSFV